MRTNPKFNIKIRKTADTQSKKSLFKVILSVIWGQARWLASLAIILFVFLMLNFYGLPPTKDASEKPRVLFKEEVSQIVADSQPVIQNRLASAISAMGGPASIGSLAVPIAQANIDFTADDELEDYDLLTLNETCLISCNNPSGMVLFNDFRRETTAYIVQQGDTPEQIAISFGINTDTLLAANNLKDGDIIKPGQELLILPINGVRIKVGSKDTVDSLAKKYNGVQMEIIAFNNLSLDGSLKGFEYLIIPGGEMPAPAKPKYVAPTKKYATSPTPAGWLIWPTTGRNWGRIHANNGVDIANDCGTPIYAAAAGKIILSDGVGWNGGYGKYIKIQHPNGVITLYGHATKLLVSEGEQVAQGQLIMLMGTTGRSTGCHLHFEVRGTTNPLAKKK